MALVRKMGNYTSGKVKPARRDHFHDELMVKPVEECDDIEL
jgi:hypothetical protein